VTPNVTYVGKEAFQNCSSLTDVTITNEATKVCSLAFDCCLNLQKIKLPSNVNVDDKWGILSDMQLDEKGCYVVASYSEGLEYTRLSDGTYEVKGIGTCKDKNIIIPRKTPTGKWIKRIGNKAFEKCSWIMSVTILNSIESIGCWAFYNCSNLRNISIPDSVLSIDECAFAGCSSLTKIRLPNRMKEISDWMFSSCSNLSEIVFPTRVKKICNGAFDGCVSLLSVTIPNSVEYIGAYSFQGCLNISNFVIPNSVQKIGECAFKGCVGIKRIFIPKSVIKLECGLFSNTAKDLIIYCERSKSDQNHKYEWDENWAKRVKEKTDRYGFITYVPTWRSISAKIVWDSEETK
jgi:hypothetical protein